MERKNRNLGKWQITRINMNIKYFSKLRELLREPVRQLGGLVSLTFVVIFSFAILNIFFWPG